MYLLTTSRTAAIVARRSAGNDSRYSAGVFAVLRAIIRAACSSLSRRRRFLLFRAVDRHQAANDEEGTEGVEEDADRAEIAAEYGVATHESDCDDDRAPEDALHERGSWFEELPM